MSVFSEVGRIIMEEASENEASLIEKTTRQIPVRPPFDIPIPNNLKRTRQRPDIYEEDLIPPPFDDEFIEDGEDMLRVVSITHTTSDSSVGKSKSLPSTSNLEKDVDEAFMELFNTEPSNTDLTKENPVMEFTQEERPLSSEEYEEEQLIEPSFISKKDSIVEKFAIPKEASGSVYKTPVSTSGTSASIIGDIVFPKGGTITADIQGNISAKETLFLYGTVFGNVDAENLILCGTIKGNLHCQTLILRSSGPQNMSKVEGAIQTESLSMEFMTTEN